jgi:hypothetical protein
MDQDQAILMEGGNDDEALNNLNCDGVDGAGLV